MLFAQKTITGLVKDVEYNEPLVGVSVIVTGTTQKALTDVNGRYSIEVPNKAISLTLAFPGYSSKVVPITGNEINVSLKGGDALGLETVVVTGVANPTSKLESSISIMTLKPSAILESAPRTTSEIFRTIPGVRSEASGGDGNTNITVRGVPISSGGSKYLQLQEDGLPVLLFGDIAFATSDIFLRADQSLNRIEAIRGGSASTLATNSPAGIINFISNTGEVKGGQVALTSGLNYGEIRTDFAYGMPLKNNMSFHIGGFYRQGEGTRTTGYTANKGGQIKANLTKKFDNGYVRLNYKFLNDRTPGYMPMPLAVSGTNANPSWAAIEGYDPNRGTMHSQFFQQNIGVGPDGTIRTAQVADGMHPVSHAIGGELSFDLGNGFTIEDRARFSFNSGRFIAPFPAAVGSPADVVVALSGTDSTLRGGTLRNTNGTPFTGGVAMIMHMFDTELQNFNNIVNDLKINKSIGDKIYLTAGYFLAQQRLNMSWLWNSYISEVKGDGSAQPLDIYRLNGTKYSQNGQFAYGVPVWGGCCRQAYDNTYTINAPYASILLKATDQLNIEGSFRYDIGSVKGELTGGATERRDVNGDGTISPIEEKVPVLSTTKRPIEYTYNNASFSLGANYSFTTQQAVFGRYSRGGAAKADRAVFNNATDKAPQNPVDVVDQAEIGYKQRFKSGGLFVTAFYSKTVEDGGFEASTQKVIKNNYDARGIEVEGSFSFPYFDIRGAATYMNAQITSGGNDGNTPRRQPNLMYNLVPTFKIRKHSLGLSLIGQTSAYTQDNNKLVMPAYTIVNAFVNVHIAKSWTLSLNGNNLFNALGITEAEEDAITENRNNYIRARPIVGRTISTSLRYNF
jgi:outer membrane receptor protein involved in Fe transport